MRPASNDKSVFYFLSSRPLRLLLSAVCTVCWAISSPMLHAQQTSPSPAPTTQPVVITLDEAISRARANEPTFAAAYAASRVAANFENLT